MRESTVLLVIIIFVAPGAGVGALAAIKLFIGVAVVLLRILNHTIVQRARA